MSKTQKRKIHKPVKMLQQVQPDASGIDVGATTIHPSWNTKSNYSYESQDGKDRFALTDNR